MNFQPDNDFRLDLRDPNADVINFMVLFFIILILLY
jgi:hypothetical protein